jgi:hypothetical protein
MDTFWTDLKLALRSLRSVGASMKSILPSA